jgi:hypothetical protein
MLLEGNIPGPTCNKAGIPDESEEIKWEMGLYLE